jgi:TonB family protein
MRSPDEDWRQDIPFLAVAVLLHAVVLSSNPSLPWSTKAPERTIPVEFVQMPVSSPALELPVPGDGSTRAPGFGPGEIQPERRGPAPKKTAAKSKPAPTRSKTVDPEVAAKRRRDARHKSMRLALARAELARQAAETAKLKAEQKAAAAESARQAAALKVREAAERRMARARKQADIARALAFLPNPDERVTDAMASAAAKPLPAGLADSLGAAPELGEEAEETPAYASDAARRTGADAYSAPASGGGYGQGGGDASFTLEGPVGSRRLVKRVLPESPEWVAQRQLDLRVQIRFQVLADGSVKPGAVISRTSGFPELDRRALDAIKRWRFAPLPGANPVWGMVSFRFTS